MLIIKSPVGLKYDPGIVKTTDWFTERLWANYSFLNCAPGPEDLLHMVTQPAQIYVEEEQNFMIDGSVLASDRRNVKLELINNLLNRIIVSDGPSLTYQDQVFITAILKKLGVTDVSEFMEQARERMKETRQIDELSQIYWERMWQLRRMSGLLGTGKDGGTDGEGGRLEREEKHSEIYYLHQAIFDRLKTGAVYQEVSNFAASPVTDRRSVGAAEIGVAEQTVTARHILLQKLKNTASHTRTTLYFNKTNVYELAGEADEPQAESGAEKRLARAALLQLATQLYALYVQRQSAGEKNWLRFTDALYRSAENTWKRMDFFDSHYVNGAESLRSYMKKVNEHYHAEMTQLERLFYGEEKTARPAAGRDGADGNASLREFLRESGMTREDVGEPAIPPGQKAERGRREEPPGPAAISALKEELDRWNERNIENFEKRLQSEKTRERSELKVDMKRSYTDSLRALEQPEEVVLRYLEEENTTLQQIREEKNAFYRQFSKETERIFRLLEKYREAPQLVLKNGLLRTDARESLQRDILLLKSVGEGAGSAEEEPDRTGQNSLPETLEYRQTEREKGEYRTYPVRKDTKERTESVRLGLTHRKMETARMDEILRDVRSVQTRLNRRTQEHEEESLTQRTVEKKQTTVTNRMEEVGREDITRLVNKSLERQLPALTDEMIRRFERKLEGGMRRRGMNG